MLSVQECKKYFKNINLSDKDIEKLRDFYYTLISNILDEYFENDNDEENKSDN